MTGLYSNAMHDFVLRELEIGKRAATAEDNGACGFGPVFDLQYAEWVRTHIEFEKWRD